MATSPEQKARTAAQRELYRKTAALPADESRKLAVEQKEKLADRLKLARDRLGNLTGRWRQFDEDLEAIGQFVIWGDELAPKTDDDSRKKRRELYARAYIRGRTSAQNLDAEIKDGSTAEVAFRDTVTKVAEVAETAKDTVATAVQKVGETAQTGLYLTIAALGVALLAYANQRGKRG